MMLAGMGISTARALTLGWAKQRRARYCSRCLMLMGSMECGTDVHEPLTINQGSMECGTEVPEPLTISLYGV